MRADWAELGDHVDDIVIDMDDLGTVRCLQHAHFRTV